MTPLPARQALITSPASPTVARFHARYMPYVPYKIIDLDLREEI